MSMSMSMSTLVVRVKRDKITACMTCPLCHKLLKQATTISLCLHTFCRKCIYERLADDDVESCPVCDISLGCVPVDKLRPDHSLQDIRAKIFPLKRRKVVAPEVAPSISPPAKRKERSLSSLVVSTPRVSMQAGVTGRRTRAGVRKCSIAKGTNQATEGTPKKDEDSLDDHVEGSSSPETLNQIIQNKKQSSSAKSSNDQVCGENVENSHEGWEGKVDLWKPLNTLVEAANRSKFSKTVLQGQSPVKPDPSNCGDADVSLTKIEVEDSGLRTESQDVKSSVPSVPGPVKRKRVRPYNKNHPSASAESSSTEIRLSAARRNWRDGPVWFSLVASRDPEGSEPLPQVSAAFLRVKDGNMPVSSIQKYLVKKLDLASEAEIQLMCQGQQVLPHFKLSNLLDLWVRSPSNAKRVRTSVGHSAKEFVMVLSYSRKVGAPAS